MRNLNKKYILVLFLLLVKLSPAQDFEITAPVGTDNFSQVVVLPNGNFVATDPYYDYNSNTDIGAVYLYDGNTKALISTLKGSRTNDRIGNGGIRVLKNGNYVISSPDWSNGSATRAGAVTIGNATTGISGTISSTNSFVGSSMNDLVGNRIDTLSNGHFVIISSYWNNGSATQAGAVTWVNQNIGITGVLSSSNSLVGSQTGDGIGNFGIYKLKNGNFVVASGNWSNGAIRNAGAATWVNGSTGRVGSISSSNSLVGTSTNDQIGTSILVLNNDNYIVNTRSWDNGSIINAGSVTWANGNTGITGVVSLSNSLVGTTANDNVGYHVVALTNGNYIVLSPDWDHGALTDVGAVTWASGSTGLTGAISPTNSLIGSTANDQVGSGLGAALTNGNFIARSPNWDRGSIVNAGAITWINGVSGRVGVVSATNSFTGTKAEDRIGNYGVTPLTNGNYIIKSIVYDNGSIVDAGAVTWGNGTAEITGSPNLSNSLMGSTANDHVGTTAIALTNGNYLVSSPSWDHGAVADVGAATWGNGSTGTSGLISPSNSLIGTSNNDFVGYDLHALPNGNYLVQSKYWSQGSISDVGAITWGNGSTGVTGAVSSNNSLVGSSMEDKIGSASWPINYNGITILSNGNYVIASPEWDHAGIANAGAITWGNGQTGISGTISAANSLLGSAANHKLGYEFSDRNTIVPLSNGNYLVETVTIPNGAVSMANGSTGLVGTINSCNSVLGEPDYTIGRNSVLNPVYNYVIIRKGNKLILSNKFLPYSASVSITSDDSDNSICDKSLVTFTATPMHGGTTPIYQWKIGAENVGTNSPSFATTSLANGQVVSVVMTSSDACALASPATSAGIATAVTTIDKAISIVNGVIIAAQNSATYQWVDCNNGNANIAGAIGQSYAPPTSGNYAVKIGLGSCSETTSCVNLEVSSIHNQNEATSLKVYPNPFTEKILIDFSEDDKSAEITVNTLDGRRVYEHSQLKENSHVIDASTWTAGEYIIHIITDKKEYAYKVNKQ